MFPLPENFAAWFAQKGWTLRAHQAAMLQAAADGVDTLLIAPTGGGKTLAGFLPSLIAIAEQNPTGLHTLYVSPLKALGTDIARNLQAPVQDLDLPITIETRSGDTPADRRARQRDQPPNILLTTPESLLLLLSHEDAASYFANLALRRDGRNPCPRRHQARRPARPLPGPADALLRRPHRRPLRHRRPPAKPCWTMSAPPPG